MAGRYSRDIVMNFRIHQDLKKEFQIICDNYRVSMSGRINDFIREYVTEIKQTNRDDLHIKKVKKRNGRGLMGHQIMEFNITYNELSTLVNARYQSLEDEG